MKQIIIATVGWKLSLGVGLVELFILLSPSLSGEVTFIFLTATSSTTIEKTRNSQNELFAMPLQIWRLYHNVNNKPPQAQEHGSILTLASLTKTYWSDPLLASRGCIVVWINIMHTGNRFNLRLSSWSLSGYIFSDFCKSQIWEDIQLKSKRNFLI